MAGKKPVKDAYVRVQDKARKRPVKDVCKGVYLFYEVSAYKESTLIIFPQNYAALILRYVFL